MMHTLQRASMITLPSPVRTCRSSAAEIWPFPSLSKTRKPSTKPSMEVLVDVFPPIERKIGKNSSKEMRLLPEKENKHNTHFCILGVSVQYASQQSLTLHFRSLKSKFQFFVGSVNIC